MLYRNGLRKGGLTSRSEGRQSETRSVASPEAASWSIL